MRQPETFHDVDALRACQIFGEIHARFLELMHDADHRLLSQRMHWGQYPDNQPFGGPRLTLNIKENMMDIKIWQWFDGKYKVFCPTVELRNKLLRWKDCAEGSVYYYPKGGRAYDVIIPAELKSKVQGIIRSQT